MTSSSPSIPNRRRFEGQVVSIAGKATAVVRIDRQVAHPKYGKFYTVSQKFLIDDPRGLAKVGDHITFEECRPISRHKRWRYVKTVRSVAPPSLLV